MLTQAPDWRTVSTHQKFFESMAQEKNISRPTDWYEVKREDCKQGGQTLLEKYYGNSLYKVLVVG